MNISKEELMKKSKNIAIFASGSGTNAENIIRYFNLNSKVKVCKIYTNNAEAGVINRAINLNVSVFIFNKEDFKYSTIILDDLLSEKIDLIVLAGFLWLIPENIIANFKNKIINIHPALLPKYGGKGMYGNFVHSKVIKMEEKESGITIHYVNDKYDDGNIIFQAKCEVVINETPESLAQKIHKLEFEHFPKEIEKLL
jgi:phosphoribosylglycinamide formyltransferase-1